MLTAGPFLSREGFDYAYKEYISKFGIFINLIKTMEILSVMKHSD